MPRIAANLSTLFTEYPVLDRPQLAAEAGFQGVEMHFPHDAPAQDLRDRLSWAGLPMIHFNAPPPNYTGGDPGWAAVPGLEDRFRRDLNRALRYAQVLKPRSLHIMAGPTEAPGARATFVANLRHAAKAAKGVEIALQVINRDDWPGYYLADYDLALEIIDEIGKPRIGLQFDIWHAQRITGDLAGTWARVRHHATQVQIASLADRGEPDAAALDFVRALDAEGWEGWIGADYRPRGPTKAGLGWLAEFC